jgi:predicted nucleic acid-binding Zn ribbon protein
MPGESGEPVAVGDAAAIVGEQLGLAEPRTTARIQEAWPAIVGDAIARHSRVRGVRNGMLDVVVDGAVWATQLRYLDSDLVEAASRLVGPGVVNAVRVTVDDGPRERPETS